MSEEALSADPLDDLGELGELGDDALLVLTAAMLTPGQYPGVLGDDYAAACAGLGLEPLHAGYGLVFGQDGTGARWTVATTDAAMVACALAAWDCGMEYDLSPDEDSMIASLPGWPLPVAVSVPGIPDPYDPDEETGGRPALTPPDTTVWGPRQRRLGADEIAVRWREWRDQFDDGEPGQEAAAEPATDSVPAAAADPHTTGTEAAAAGTSTGTGAPSDLASVADSGTNSGAQSGSDTGTATDSGAKRARDTPEPPEPPTVSHHGVRYALERAEEYVRNPPPPGRVRTAYGAVRADGPGWSLVGRTDDMAFVLLDDVPGQVLPVGRGPSLPPLLEALSKLASVSAP
jgi:hypothetical protein